MKKKENGVTVGKYTIFNGDTLKYNQRSIYKKKGLEDEKLFYSFPNNPEYIIVNNTVVFYNGWKVVLTSNKLTKSKLKFFPNGFLVTPNDLIYRGEVIFSSNTIKESICPFVDHPYIIHIDRNKELRIFYEYEVVVHVHHSTVASSIKKRNLPLKYVILHGHLLYHNKFVKYVSPNDKANVILKGREYLRIGKEVVWRGDVLKCFIQYPDYPVINHTRINEYDLISKSSETQIFYRNKYVYGGNSQQFRDIRLFGNETSTYLSTNQCLFHGEEIVFAFNGVDVNPNLENYQRLFGDNYFRAEFGENPEKVEENVFYVPLNVEVEVRDFQIKYYDICDCFEITGRLSQCDLTDTWFFGSKFGPFNGKLNVYYWGKSKTYLNKEVIKKILKRTTKKTPPKNKIKNYTKEFQYFLANLCFCVKKCPTKNPFSIISLDVLKYRIFPFIFELDVFLNHFDQIRKKVDITPEEEEREISEKIYEYKYRNDQMFKISTAMFLRLVINTIPLVDDDVDDEVEEDVYDLDDNYEDEEEY